MGKKKGPKTFSVEVRAELGELYDIAADDADTAEKLAVEQFKQRYGVVFDDVSAFAEESGR